jgi:hypothetical protein
MSLHSFSTRRRRRQGVTLILVLSFVLLLTAVVLVFLSRALIARQLSSGSLKQSSADQFALSALDVVTGNLKQEIAAPTLSSATTYNGTAPAVYTVYRPLSSTNAVPIRFGNPAFTSPSPDPAPNLVRISSHSDGSQSFPSSLASAVNSTTDASVNGRAVSLARWNSHYLLPLAGATDTTPASFTPPDWVFVTDTGGPTVLTAPNSSVIGRYAYAIYDEGGLLDVNVAGYPSKSTVAQSGDKPGLAYADLTQLALPSAPTTPLLSTTDVDNLVGWRNYASVQPTGSFGSFTISAGQAQNFFSMIANNVTGFTTVNPATYNNCTDQAFLSRQQLLKYATTTGLNTNALQYLGTFSRDLNAPSWSPVTPTAGIPSWGSAISSGSTYDYTYHKNDAAAANRDILGVRVTGTFTRADGTTAQIGEPLVKYRFPLNRLQGLTYQGIDATDTTTLGMTGGTRSAASAQTIQRDFGLVWIASGTGNPTDILGSPHWNYCGANGTAIQSSIETLAQVAAENREPNFFELLKAAILSGSLGRDAGQNGTYNKNFERGPASGNQINDLNSDLQIIQLGANIIDQSDSDSYPTEIHFIGSIPLFGGGTTNGEMAVYGIENLPYLQRVFAKTIRYNDNSNPPNPVGASGVYLAEVWNPHQNFGYTGTTTIPTNFRFAGEGHSTMFIPSYPNQQKDNPSWPDPSLGPPNSVSYDLSQSGFIQFTVPWNSNTCREPTYISTDSHQGNYLAPTQISSGSNGSNDPFADGSAPGIYTGTIQIYPDDLAPPPNGNGDSAGVSPQNCDLMLEYQAADGSWRIYDKMRNLSGCHDWDPWAVCFYFEHVDPRTDRFGTSLGMWIYGGNSNNPGSAVQPPGNTIRVDNSINPPKCYWSYDYFPVPYTELTPATTSGFNYTHGNADSQIFSQYSGGAPNDPLPYNFMMGCLSDNVATSDPSYSDQDGVLRPAEGAYATGVDYDARPLVPCYIGNSVLTQARNRPIILNRPFHNVGELGYAFRDLPWKNVDFFTPYSGDAGLLDFFCINESTTTTPMVAGTVNLNTRQAPVLQAIIAGAIKDETGIDSPVENPVPNTEAASIANNIVNWTQSTATGQGPFQYRSDLLTKAISPTSTLTLIGSTAATQDQQIKTLREASLRALSDVGTTRTWTLLVDLVAQVGHYPPGATSLKQFIVDGEKRYWLHLTLDRYTGQVVDRVLEPVYE